MKRITLLLISMIVLVQGFAQFRTMQDMLNRFSSLDMCHLNTSSFLQRNHQYDLLKNEKFLDRLIYNHRASDRLAKEIAKSLSKRSDWPSWIKNGVKPEDEKYFTSLVGVAIPGVYIYDETLLAFVPELNFHLPEAYKFKEPFSIFAPSSYYVDHFDPRVKDSSAVLPENVSRWLHEMNTQKKAKPVVLDMARNLFYPYGQKAYTTEGYLVEPETLSYLEATMLTANTSTNPKWLKTGSYFKNHPKYIGYLSNEELKTLKVYAIHSAIKGYQFDPGTDRFTVLKTFYIRVPEAENHHLDNSIAWAPGRDLFFKYTMHLPPSHELLKDDQIDSSSFKKFNSSYITYLLPGSKEGKIANIIRDFFNDYKNISKAVQPKTVTGGWVRRIDKADQLSDHDRDVVSMNSTTKKIVYSSYLTPRGDSAWTYDACLEYLNDMNLILVNYDFFSGMDGFSAVRKPSLVRSSYRAVIDAQQQKDLGYYISDYDVKGSGNNEAQYAYDDELAYRYTYSLRARMVIRADDTKPSRFYVLLLFFDKN